ncbi:MAG: phosphate acyltransferase PlsX [Balneolaceae bacterium]
MVIAVDAVGGDHFPENPISGGVMALEENNSLEIVFVGPIDLIKKELEKHSYDHNRVDILDAPEIVSMDDPSSAPVKSKPHSSINLGIKALKSGSVNGFISAGNTGALLTASTLFLGKLEGVIRPTIAAIFPTVNGVRLLVDAGANLELKPEMYFQFAKMGSIYAKEILGIENPKVGLLNIGSEPEKGCEIHKDSFKELQKLSNFAGNIEGKDILSGKADVFVTDGFTGNILLKFGESVPQALEHLFENAIKEMGLEKEIRNHILQVLKKAVHTFDYQHVGGVPFLGVDGVSLVGHGGSTPLAIKNMIVNAAHCVESRLNEKIVTSLNI